MKALENRALFSGHFDHERQMRIHRQRLRHIKHVVNTKEPDSIHTRCFSPSKQLMSKNAEQNRVMHENLQLAQKIFNIMEGEGEITQMVNDTRHIDNHPGTMNFRLRLHEAQEVHARNMLLASRLDSVKPYYRASDIRVVRPIRKLKSRKRRTPRRGRFAKEFEYAINSEHFPEQSSTPRSESKATYSKAFKFKEVENSGSLSARTSGEGVSSARAGNSRPKNILLEYTKIQEGRVLDVAVLKEPFRDRYAIFGIDVDDGQRYELRLTSDDVSNILDGDILVTSVDNIEVWMALLNKVALRKVSQFSVISGADSKERSVARSYDSMPKSEAHKHEDNRPRRNNSDNQFNRKSDMATDQPNFAARKVPMPPMGARPSAERPVSRSAGSARGRGSRGGGSSRPSGAEADDAMVMDAPAAAESTVAAAVVSIGAEPVAREPQVPTAIPEEGEEDVSPQTAVQSKAHDVPAKPIKHTPTKPKGPGRDVPGQKTRNKLFTVGYRSARSERKQSASPRVTATIIEEGNETEAPDAKPKPPSVAVNRSAVAAGKGRESSPRAAVAKTKPESNKGATAATAAAGVDSVAKRASNVASTSYSRSNAVSAAATAAKQGANASKGAGIATSQAKADLKPAVKPGSQPQVSSKGTAVTALRKPATSEQKKRMVATCQRVAADEITDAVQRAVDIVSSTMSQQQEKDGASNHHPGDKETNSAASSNTKKMVSKIRILSKLKNGRVFAAFGLKRSDAKPMKTSSFFSFFRRKAELPPSVDLRRFCSDVEDQSRTNSCCANAVVGSYEYLCKRAAMEQGDTPGDVSRLFVYYVGRLRDKQLYNDWSPLVDDGLTLAGAIDALTMKGACLERTWDFDLEKINVEPPAEAYAEAMRYKIASAEEVPVDLESMKTALAQGLPIIFGLKLTEKFFATGPSGYVSMPDPKDPQSSEHGMHCMLIVGYIDALRCFIVRNSWGEEWGDKGYCYVPYTYCTNPLYNCCGQYVIRHLTDTDFTPDDREDAFNSPAKEKAIAKAATEDQGRHEVQEVEENIESTGGSVLLDLERIRDIFGIESEAKRAFRAIDRNGDGAISTNELAELLRLNGTASTEEQVMQLKRKYDKDADGKISFEEFLKIPGVLSTRSASHVSVKASATASATIGEKRDESESQKMHSSRSKRADIANTEAAEVEEVAEEKVEDAEAAEVAEEATDFDETAEAVAQETEVDEMAEVEKVAAGEKVVQEGIQATALVEAKDVAEVGDGAECEKKLYSADVMRRVGASVDSAASTVNAAARDKSEKPRSDSRAAGAAASRSLDDSTPDVAADELQDYSSELFEADSELSPSH